MITQTTKYDLGDIVSVKISGTNRPSSTIGFVKNISFSMSDNGNVIYSYRISATTTELKEDQLIKLIPEVLPTEIGEEDE